MGTDMPGVGSSGVGRSNRKTDNEAKRMKGIFNSLIDIATKEVVRTVFPVVVRETVQDSGQAAYNWWIGVSPDKRRRFYVDEQNLGPIGRSGEKRTAGGISPEYKSLNDTNPSKSPELIIGLKISYMESLVSTKNFTNGAVIYNQTPTNNEFTFKGTYEGNAKIRVAMSIAMVNAEGALDRAAMKVGSR